MKNRVITLEGTISDTFAKNNGSKTATAVPVQSQSLTTQIDQEPFADLKETLVPVTLTELTQFRNQASLHALASQRQSETVVLGLSQRDLNTMASPWEMFSQQLSQQIQGLDQFKGLQLISTPLSANWNDSTYGNWRAWRLIADTMPAWGATYSPTGMQFTTGYYTFITNLDIPLPDDQDRKNAESARKDYMSTIDDLNRAMGDLGPHWKAFDDKQSTLPPNRRLSFDEWYKRFDGQKISSLNDRVTLAAQKYTSWLVKAYRGFAFVADILTNYNNPAFQLSAQSPDSLMNFYRTYNITPDLGAWIEDSKKLVAAGAPPKMSFTLTKDSGQRHTENTVWGGSASWFGGFFGFGASAGGSRTAVDVTNQHFRMDFSARNLDLFTITPGQWFNGTAVKALKNGPFIADGPVARGTLKLFSPDGILNLEPVQLLVAFRPKVSCSISRDEFHEIKASFYASGGFSIGPFGFGASYSRSTDDVSFDDSTNSIVAQDSSDTPQIIAIVSKVLPDFQ
jgi:hypothetical protein